MQEPPETPSDFEVAQVSSRTANFSWVTPYNGNSPILKYIIEYKRTKGDIYAVEFKPFEIMDQLLRRV